MVARGVASIAAGVRKAIAAVRRMLAGQMQVRAIALTVTLSLVAVLSVGFYIAMQLRDGLLQQRVDQILAETHQSTLAAQHSFDASTAANPAELDAQITLVASDMQSSGSSSRWIFFLRTPRSGVLTSDFSTWNGRPPISADMRAAVQGSDEQQMQYVSLNLPTGKQPGLVVGSRIALPVAGTYELYFAYSLAVENQTLALVKQVLSIVGVLLMGLIAGISYFVTRQVIGPVQNASDVAARLAAGDLDERMPVRGKDEMARLGQSFNSMAQSLQVQIERMESLSQAQRRFVSDVSHELRTPLTTVRIAAHVLEDAKDTFPPDVARSTELMVTQLDRFEALLADLLEISRFDAGAAQLDADEADLRDIVVRAVDMVMPFATSKGVFVHVILPSMGCQATVDARRIERILRNLLANAIEHAEGKPVEVKVGADSLAIAVVVKDHGVGLSAEQAEHVFDRFWRADPARARATGGTGLGLAIALEDAHLHAGKLEVVGQAGEGAAFRLTLPRRAGIVLRRSPLTMAGDPNRTDIVTAEIPIVTPGGDDGACAKESAPEADTGSDTGRSDGHRDGTGESCAANVAPQTAAACQGSDISTGDETALKVRPGGGE